MKEFQIFVSASYITDGGSKEWNAFKEYTKANSATEAKRNLKAELKADGYKNIEMEVIKVA